LAKFISFEVTPVAQTGTTTGTPVESARTAAVLAASSGEGPPSTPSTPTPTPSAQPGGGGAEVLVNGKVENAGTATTTEVNDQTVTTIAVDAAKLEAKLEAEGQNAVVTIAIRTNSEVVIGELNGQMIKNMEQKQAVVEIKTDTATYRLPAQQININAISDQLGQTVSLQDIKIQIQIADPTAATVKVVEDSAAKGEFSLVVPPLNFTVTGSYGGTSIEISTFNAYVERVIAIPDGVDPNKITTGIIIDPDGTVRHVPTQVIRVGGKYFARINSLTNSTYSVVWHPLEFKDVVNHWAKTAVNNMGSRMVINGTGSDLFEPDKNITRAEFAAVIVRALGLKTGTGNHSFTDVSSTEWYSGYIRTAAEYKIIEGYSGGMFGPNDTLTREQAMTMITRAMSITGLASDITATEAEKLLSGFGDAEGIAGYARNSIAACVQLGIVSGRTSHLVAPKEHITRAEVAVIVQRLLQKSNLI
ncbi:S-layer homology domain-containing protein, partial [Paenibacillus sp. sgz500958]|uniref:S-layer homology domain-containing protein n=1 Tax=Paenibacillus sp. sgz500958 TaxID=3242475 RepID=UPI0036D26FA9